jgi:hypothetical protein
MDFRGNCEDPRGQGWGWRRSEAGNENEEHFR